MARGVGGLTPLFWLPRVILTVTVAKIKGAKKAASSRRPREPFRADRHQSRTFGPQQRAADRAARIDLRESGSVECQLAQINRRHFRLGSGRWAQALEIDDQNLVVGDDQAIDLPGQHPPLDEPDDRYLGLRVRAEDRREIRVAQYPDRLPPDVVLYLRGETVCRRCQEPARRVAAPHGRQIGQALHQPVDQEPALEAVAPVRSERRDGGGLVLARP